MSGNKVVKSVSFNVTNKQDREYLELIQNVNFSGYVKWLIEEDIRQQIIIKEEGATNRRNDTSGTIVTSGISPKSNCRLVYSPFVWSPLTQVAMKMIIRHFHNVVYGRCKGK
jgi:hypothetical protein